MIADATRPRTFADLAVGEELGRVPVDPRDLLAEWRLVHPDLPATDTLPPGLLVAVLMRGYLALATDRPPGNIHAGLDLVFGPPASTDRPIMVSLAVAGKTVRKGRNRVTFDLTCAQDDRAVLEARSIVLWAE